MDPQRRQRIRSLIRQLNRGKRTQKKQIEMLSTDMLASQKKFVHQLQHYNFTLDFYESVIGLTDIGRLLLTAEQKIKEHIPGVCPAFFILEPEMFNVHYTNDRQIEGFDPKKFLSSFDPHTVINISRCNTICTIEDMFALGLAANLKMLSKVNAHAIPLSGFGPAEGFMLVWFDADNPVKQSQLDRLATIAVPLAHSIRNCKKLTNAIQHTS